MEESPITRERIDELLSFLPTLGAPGAYTEPETRTHSPDAVLTLPHVTYPQDVEEFAFLAGQDCWCDPDYMDKQAGELIRDDVAIASASLDQIRTMLTFVLRRERFSPGHLAAMLRDGRIAAILRRLNELRESVK